MKKLLSFLLAGCMMMSMAACGKGGDDKDKTDPSALDYVKLKMVLLGDTPTDLDKVYDEVNKHLKEDINCEVSIEFLSWADWSKKYPLLLAQKDAFDVIASANWSNYFKNAREGAFAEITEDMLKKYAPQTYANKECLEPAYVDGKLYNLPMDYSEITIDGYIVRGDIMDALGMKEIVSMDDFETYLKGVKEKYPNIMPWDVATKYAYLFRNAKSILSGGVKDAVSKGGYGPIVMDIKSNPTVYSMLDKPEFAEYCKKMKEWNDAGFWSKSVMVNTVEERDSFINGTSAAFIDNLNQASATYSQVAVSHPEWDMRFYPINTNKYLANPTINNGMAISANSKNAERVLMMLDLFRYDEWYNRTTTYGIEGTHWKLDDKGNYVALDAAVNFIADSACPWGWRNTKFYLTPANSFKNYADVMNKAKENTYKTNVESFAVDKTVGNITSIEAAMKTVSDQYLKPLLLGISKDVDKDIANLKKQYEAAGMNELMKEYQKQIDAYGVKVE